jgi:hypothetical protein
LKDEFMMVLASPYLLAGLVDRSFWRSCWLVLLASLAGRSSWRVFAARSCWPVFTGWSLLAGPAGHSCWPFLLVSVLLASVLLAGLCWPVFQFSFRPGLNIILHIFELCNVFCFHFRNKACKKMPSEYWQKIEMIKEPGIPPL